MSPKSEDKDKRKYERYDTDVEAFFQRIYNVKRKMDFRLVNTEDKKVSSTSFPASTLNISAQGICFVCDRRLKQGDTIALEVVLQDEKKTVHMEGLVRWARVIQASKGGAKSRGKAQYAIGVKLITVDGYDVLKSIIYDPVYKVFWSNVLQALIGHFRHEMHLKAENAVA